MLQLLRACCHSRPSHHLCRPAACVRAGVTAAQGTSVQDWGRSAPQIPAAAELLLLAWLAPVSQRPMPLAAPCLAEQVAGLRFALPLQASAAVPPAAVACPGSAVRSAGSKMIGWAELS